LAFGGVAGGAAQVGERELVRAHKALLETGGIQFDFAQVKQEPPPAWMNDVIAFFTAIAPVMKYVFWGGLIAGGVVIVYFVLREVLPERMRAKRTEVAVTDWRPQEAQARALLEDADRLAAEGRYEEAIHLLLFRSIDDLAGRRPGLVKPALTSRDIAGLDALPEAPRSAFARLARAVELSFFGGRPAGKDAFGEARADYEAFAFAENWR
jgi:hypothetical protein